MTEYSGLLTDLYELTMAAGYLQTRFDGRATFELFVRHLPPQRNYLVAAGLEQALEFLENVRFTPEEIDYLRQHRVFRHIREEFFTLPREIPLHRRRLGDARRHARISGRADAARHGADYRRPDSGNVSARHAQLPDHGGEQGRARGHRGTGPPGRGFRRASRARREASLLAARAAVDRRLPGNLQRSGRPAFRNRHLRHAGAFLGHGARETKPTPSAISSTCFPRTPCFSLDTYDVRNAARKKSSPWGESPRASGSIAAIWSKDSRWVRRELDRAGWKDVKIFASGDLDEYENRVAASPRARRSTRFGVGTALATPGDAPQLNMIYKLVEVERGRKNSRSRETDAVPKPPIPGRKQVFRYYCREWRIQKRPNRARKRAAQWRRTAARRK